MIFPTPTIVAQLSLDPTVKSIKERKSSAVNYWTAGGNVEYLQCVQRASPVCFHSLGNKKYWHGLNKPHLVVLQNSRLPCCWLGSSGECELAVSTIQNLNNYHGQGSTLHCSIKLGENLMRSWKRQMRNCNKPVVTPMLSYKKRICFEIKTSGKNLVELPTFRLKLKGSFEVSSSNLTQSQVSKLQFNQRTWRWRSNSGT